MMNRKKFVEQILKMKQILYTYAKDTSGCRVKAADAIRGSGFFCLVCESQLTLRKSGNTGKGAKRPHFAHRASEPNCSPETALHFSFKHLLGEKIAKHLADQKPLPIRWQCIYCDEEHIGDLLKKIKSVKVEYNLTVCQPDIALFDSEGNVFAVVEIVVTHKPNEQAIKFYSENNIILVQVNLSSDSDLENLEQKISNPDLVGTCFNPKCKTCGQHQQKTRMMVIEAPCRKCGTAMKVAIVHGAKLRDSHIGPDKFSKGQIQIAESKGVVIAKNYSETVGHNYLANTCLRCKAFIGKHYLFTSYLAPASYGELISEEYEIDYHCDHRFPAENQ